MSLAFTACTFWRPHRLSTFIWTSPLFHFQTTLHDKITHIHVLRPPWRQTRSHHQKTSRLTEWKHQKSTDRTKHDMSTQEPFPRHSSALWRRTAFRKAEHETPLPPRTLSPSGQPLLISLTVPPSPLLTDGEQPTGRWSLRGKARVNQPADDLPSGVWQACSFNFLFPLLS